MLAVLLLADGIYMELANYQPGDQNAFFGNQNVILNDGTTVLIAGGLLAVVSVAAWWLAARRGAAPSHQGASHQGPSRRALVRSHPQAAAGQQQEQGHQPRT